MITTIKLNTAAKAAPLGTSSPWAQGLVIILNEFLFLIEVIKASYHISFILLYITYIILFIFKKCKPGQKVFLTGIIGKCQHEMPKNGNLLTWLKKDRCKFIIGAL